MVTFLLFRSVVTCLRIDLIDDSLATISGIINFWLQFLASASFEVYGGHEQAEFLHTSLNSALLQLPYFS